MSVSVSVCASVYFVHCEYFVILRTCAFSFASLFSSQPPGTSPTPTPTALSTPKRHGGPSSAVAFMALHHTMHHSLMNQQTTLTQERRPAVASSHGRYSHSRGVVPTQAPRADVSPRLSVKRKPNWQEQAHITRLRKERATKQKIVRRPQSQTSPSPTMRVSRDSKVIRKIKREPAQSSLQRRSRAAGLQSRKARGQVDVGPLRRAAAAGVQKQKRARTRRTRTRARRALGGRRR